MKYGFMTGLALAGTMALGVAAADAAPQLGAWWSFNNSTKDSDLDWNTGNDNSRNNFGHMQNANSFEDGYWDSVNDRLYPVNTGSSNNPGVLVGPAARGAAQGSTPTDFGVYIDVSNLVGNNDDTQNNNWLSLGGTTNNMPYGNFGGGSLSITGSANNGSTFDIVVTDAGYQVAEVSWAARGTSTGYDFRGVSYTTDGETWVPFWNETGTLSTSFTVKSVDFAGIDGITAIRFTVDDATSTNGKNRFDNIQLMVDTYIPEPASLALMAVGGLMLIRRRPQA